MYSHYEVMGICIVHGWCCEILFCQSTIVRGFLIGTEGGRQGEGDVGGQGRRILLSLGEFMFDSWHTVLLLF